MESQNLQTKKNNDNFKEKNKEKEKEKIENSNPEIKEKEKNDDELTHNINTNEKIIKDKEKSKEKNEITNKNENINDIKNNSQREIKEEEKEKKDDKKEDKKEVEKEKENQNIVNKNYRREMSIKDWGCKSLDQYEIEKPVGEGTFGKVFKAEYKGPKDYQERLGIPKIVALKKIKTESEKQGFPITALREIMIMKKLYHKNILQLFEVITSKPKEKNDNKGDVYLVFEYMEHDLCSLIHSNFFYEKSQIKLIIYQLLQGLQYLHQNNVLHRDIKPQNILVNNKGEIKIGDFGLSRIFSEFIKNKRYTNRVVTRWYRCPELLLGETNYGPAIDIWSIGCVFWEILTGDILFRGEDEKDVFLQICKKCGTPSEINWPGISQLPQYNKIMPSNKYECELDKKYQKYSKFDETTFDLFKKMICLNPKERITIEEALKHPYFTTHEPKMCEEKDMPKIEEDFHHYSKNKKDQSRQQHVAKGEYKEKSKTFIGKKRNLK